jgi:CelD/BcsL family acetyltransferase involved in cellulose biosynthesis
MVQLTTAHRVPTVTTELISGAGSFTRLEADWRLVYELSASQNPFLCWEWVSSWVANFCGDRLRTVVVRRDGRVVGIAPLHLNRYLIGPGLHANALQLFGPKEVQHLFEIREMLVLPGLEGVALEAVVDRAVTIPGWDWIELSALGAGLDELHSLALRRGGHGLDAVFEPVTQIPVMALESTWELQRQKLKRNIKESIRHCQNALRRDGHVHSFTADAGASGANEAVKRLLELHRRRSTVQERKQHRDSFADASTRAFEADALTRMHAGGRARFAELEIDCKTVAARACIEAHGSLYLYYSGFDPVWWNYSVMTLVVTAAIQDAIARGLTSVNFSPGVDNSKSRWGVELTPLQSASLVRSNPAARARFSLLRIRKRIRQPLHRQLERALSLLRPRSAMTRIMKAVLPSK